MSVCSAVRLLLPSAAPGAAWYRPWFTSLVGREPAHLAVAAAALEALKASPDGRLRLGLLHNPKTAGSEDVAAAWVAAATATDVPAAADVRQAAVAAAHRDLCAELGLAAGEGAIVTNGRIVRLASAGALDAVDLSLLEEFEFRQRAEGAYTPIVEHMAPDDGGGESTTAACTRGATR